MEEIENFFDNFLLIEVIEEDNSNQHLRVHEILSEKTIMAIEMNLKFFTDIPSDKWEEVFADFFKILYRYNLGIEKEELELTLTKKGFITKIKKKPSDKIKSDIRIIENYQEMLKNSFGIQEGDKNSNNVIFINTPNYIKSIYKNNIRLLTALQNKDEEIIYRYNNPPRVNKNHIKQFLQEIKIKYNLSRSLDKKELIDKL